MVDFNNSTSNNRTILLSLAICVIAVSFAGCRCQQPCAPQQYTPYNTAPAYSAPGSGTVPGYGTAPNFNTAPTYNNGFGFNSANRNGNAATQARIPAPATYSLNIPGVNNNANNLNQNRAPIRVGQLPSGLLNTRQTAPTPANRPANYNQSQGWRQSNGANLNTSSTGQIGSGNRVADASLAPSVLESSSRINNTNGAPISRTASLNNASGSGVSFTQSNDYRTTSIDERQDNTRLPVTDATNVRGTTPFAQNNNGSGQYVRPYYQPRQQNQQRAAAPVPTTYQGAFTQPQTYQGSFAQRYNSAQPQRQVLAQSTARFDPFESTASSSSDWRDRGRQSY
jgi:hypothetical protein